MLTVYCEKMSSGAGIAPGVYGLAGVIIGAIISGGIAYLIQKQNSKNNFKLETEKHKINLTSSYLLDDILKFLDDEIQDILDFCTSTNDNEKYKIPAHLNRLGAIEISIRVFRDDALVDDFKRVIAKGFELRQISDAEKKLGGDVIMFKEIISEIALLKIKVIEHCQFNLK
ncbi:hypothetical protein [uncultured Pluralibacter sp.]|uniref:hypothetical protein n=1 Tax=uncultured Pluralibacter sp. TaxID=1490864 RepID=UPI0026359072|nr:hypothetical protein [uncultured Pluralibacter sp.]